MPKKKPIPFPEVIRVVRGSLSRAEFARRAKITASTVYAHEKGIFLPTETTYEKLVKAAPGLKDFPKPNLSDMTPRGPASDYGGHKNVRTAPPSPPKPVVIHATEQVATAAKKRKSEVGVNTNNKNISVASGTDTFNISTRLLLELAANNLPVLFRVLTIAKEDKLDLDKLLHVVNMFTK